MPSSRDLPNPGIEPRSPALQVDSLPSETPGKPLSYGNFKNMMDTTESSSKHQKNNYNYFL